jgi:hypothetical protein
MCSANPDTTVYHIVVPETPCEAQSSLSSVVANQRQRIKIVETGETIQMTAPDQVLISGVLQSGKAARSHRCTSKAAPPTGRGSVRDPRYRGHPGYRAGRRSPGDLHTGSEFTLRGAQAGKPLADLSIPESYRWVPPAVPVGLPFNVAPLYLRMAERIRAGKSVSPDFDVAVKRHQLLDQGVGHRIRQIR